MGYLNRGAQESSYAQAKARGFGVNRLFGEVEAKGREDIPRESIWYRTILGLICRTLIRYPLKI